MAANKSNGLGFCFIDVSLYYSVCFSSTRNLLFFFFSPFTFCSTGQGKNTYTDIYSEQHNTKDQEHREMKQTNKKKSRRHQVQNDCGENIRKIILRHN